MRVCCEFKRKTNKVIKKVIINVLNFYFANIMCKFQL